MEENVANWGTTEASKNYVQSASNRVKDMLGLKPDENSPEATKAVQQAQETKTDIQSQVAQTKEDVQNSVYANPTTESQEVVAGTTNAKLDNLENKKIPSDLNTLVQGSGLETRLGVETMKGIDQLMDMYVNSTLGDVLQPRLRDQFRATMELVLMKKFSWAHGGKESENTSKTSSEAKKPTSLMSWLFEKLGKVSWKAGDLKDKIQGPLSTLQTSLNPLFEKLGVASVVNDTLKIIWNLTTILQTAKNNELIDKDGNLNASKMPGTSRETSMFADSRKLSSYLIDNPDFKEKTLDSALDLNTVFMPFFQLDGPSTDTLALATEINKTLKDTDIATIQKATKDGTVLLNKALATGNELKKSGIWALYDECKDSIRKMFPMVGVFLDFLFGTGSDNLITTDNIIEADAENLTPDENQKEWEKFEPEDEKEIDDIHTGKKWYETTNPDAIQAELDKVRGVPFDAKQVNKSAQKYNVPVSYLLAFMRNDSSYGTDGSSAINNHNPGNVGNTDDGKNKYFATRQDGIDGCASNIRKRINAYQKLCGEDAFPTMKELATGVVSQDTKKGKKFYGVYMTSKQGQNTVVKIEDKIDDKLAA